MNIKMINKIKSQGHPCRGCPYVFTRGGTDCIMDAVPGDCAWYFYKRLMGHTDATIPSEEIRKQYRRNQKRLNRIVLLTQTNSLPDIHNIGGEWVINQMLTDLLIEQEYIRKREREN